MKGEASDPGKLNRLLKIAALAGVESAVKLHVTRGDDLDARDDSGMTPLMLAASRNRAAICSMLLEAGADPLLRTPSGQDALAFARTIGAADAVLVLEHCLSGRSAEVEAESPLDMGTAVPDTADVAALPFFDISAQLGDRNSFDLSGWETEEESVAPEGDPDLALLAGNLHRSISGHRPVDLSDDWDNIEAFLPQRSIPLPKANEAEWS
jgi:RNA polymerase primary sigma factor